MSDVDALLDLYGGGEPAAPATSPTTDELKNFFQTEIASPKEQALPKAVGAAVEDPEKAAAAIKVSKQTGMPATVVAADPDAAQVEQRSREASQYVGSSENIQSYVNSYPLSAHVSNDDWKMLHDINLYAGAAFGVMPIDPEMTAKLPPYSWVVGIYDLVKQVGDAFSGKEPLVSGSDKELALAGSMALLIAGGRPFPKARAPLSTSAEIDTFLREAGHGPVETQGMRDRADIDAFLKRKDQEAGAPKLLEGPKEAPPELTPAAQTHLKAGEIPPAGVDPVVDKFHIAQAGRDLEAFDITFQMVKKSKTAERSPEMMEAYLTKVLGNKTLSIPVEAVEKLYGTEVPADGDKKLGYEPGMEGKLTQAKESGTDINITMARFLAHTDEATYSALKDDLRLRDEGVTKTEGKELKDVEEPKLKEGEEAPPPPTVQEAVKKSFYFQPLFQNAKVVGMTEGEYAKYFNKVQKADQDAYQKIIDKEARRAKRELTPEWKSNEAEIRSEVDTDLRSRPDIISDRLIRTGEKPSGEKVPMMKLERREVLRYVKAGQASKDMLERYSVEKGGMAIDFVADQAGYQSGAAMIRDLSRLEKDRGTLGPKEHFNQLVKDETAKRMEAKYGDLPQQIMEEARDAALAEHQIDILHDEMRALAKADGKEAPYTKAELEAYVEAKFQTRQATEVGLETFRRSAEKAGKAAEKALLAGKFDEAFKAKQQQFLSTREAKLARSFERRQKAAKRLYDRYADNKVLRNVDQGYKDQVDRILANVGLPTARNPLELNSALQGKSLADFIKTKEDMGRIVPVDQQLINSGKKFEDFTVAEADNFHDSVATLDHNGKGEKFITKGSEKLDFEIAVNRATTEMDKNKPRYLPRRPGAIARLKTGVYEWDAMLVKMEQLFDWLDGNDPFGVFNDVVWRGLADGKHKQNDMMRELGQKIKDLPASRSFQRSLTNRIENTELLDWQTGAPMNMTGQDLIAIMLNMGNRSNFGKLTGQFEYNGKLFKWDPLAVKGLVKQNATKEHWDFVQGIWDTFDHYWPQVEELSRKVSGVAPDKIVSVPIKTQWGEYKGGYFPLRADANWTGPREGATGVFGADRYFRAVPPKGYTMPRTGATYPLDLNYSSVIPMMEQMIHDLAFREPLMSAVKFLEDTRIQQGISRAFGPEYLAQVKPWLEYTATSKRVNDEALSGMNKMARWSRERLVAVQLLYRASTVIKHTTAALFDSFGESGLYDSKAKYMKDFSASMARLYGTPDGWRIISEMHEKSGELRNRMHDMDRDIGDAMDRTLGQSGMRAVAMHYGGYAVSLLDLGSANAVWYTHYKEALVQGHEELDARVVADKAVRAAHGAAGVIDLPAIQRGSEITRLFTVAYSFFNHNYNRVRMIGRETKQGFEDLKAGQTADAFDKFMSAAYRSLWYIVLLGAAEEWIAPIPSEKGERHGLLRTAAEMVGIGSMHQLIGSLPFIRDFGRALLYGRKDVSPTPLGQLFTTIAGALEDFYMRAAGHRVKNNSVRRDIEAIGYVLKLPGFGQLAASMQYLWDLRQHRQTGENPYRLGRGVLLGKSHPEIKMRR